MRLETLSLKVLAIVLVIFFNVSVFCENMNGKSNKKNISEVNIRCRNNLYPDKQHVPRFHVPDDKIFWNVTWDGYKPNNYTSKKVLGKAWADAAVPKDLGWNKFQPRWNTFEVEKLINRVSCTGNYSVVNNYPLNPFGRTGLSGRGSLERWGPNHLANLLLTRWKVTGNKTAVDQQTKLPILQLLMRRRLGHSKYMIPYKKMVIGVNYNLLMLKIYLKDLIDLQPLRKKTKKNPKIILQVVKKIEHFFKNGTIIYKGYIDDYRNTDNAWVEITAMHFHDEKGDIVAPWDLNDWEPRSVVIWVDLHSKLNVRYNFHLVERVAKRMKCHWENIVVSKTYS